MTGQSISYDGGWHINVSKNLLVFLTALIAFSLWLATTITLPKKVESIDARVHAVENNYHQLQGKMDIMGQDIRDIKNILMREKK